MSTLAVMPSGVCSATNRSSWTSTRSGCWSGTSRKLIFATARAGMIVLKPGPV
jgi:hypothetical protein